MSTEKKPSFPATLTGMAGFFISALAGILTGFLFFRLGITEFLTGLIPDDQPFIRLITALILSFLGIGLAGAVFGLLSGATLLRIDPQGSRKRYLMGGAFAYGISFAILLIPSLLLTTLFAKYNQGSSKDPGSYIALFAIIGLVYGIVGYFMFAAFEIIAKRRGTLETV